MGYMEYKSIRNEQKDDGSTVAKILASLGKRDRNRDRSKRVRVQYATKAQ
jgi:hypothetical protein